MLIIDMQATGRNIKKMIADKGINMKQMQDAFGFQTPQAIYINGIAEQRCLLLTIWLFSHRCSRLRSIRLLL